MESNSFGSWHFWPHGHVSPLVAAFISGVIITEHIWIISSLSLFLESDFITSSKQYSQQCFTICSAITGSVLQLLGTLVELKLDVKLARNSKDVVGVIERILFLCKPDLLISCGSFLQRTLLR